MKKTITTIAILLGLALGATAQKGGGLFERGDMSEGSHRNSGSPMLPVDHNMDGDQPADPSTPIEGGVALLFGMAVMYLTRKRGDD